MNNLIATIERLASRRWFLPGLGIAAVAAIAILAFAGWTQYQTIASPAGPKPTPQAIPTISAVRPTLDPRLIDPQNGSKFSYLYLRLFEAYSKGGEKAAEQEARDLGLLDEQGVHAVLILKGPPSADLLSKLSSAGITVDHIYENQVSVTFPMTRLVEVSASRDFGFAKTLIEIDEVVDIQAPIKMQNGLEESTLNLGAAESRPYVIGTGPSEGVKWTGADAWHAAGIRGQNVRVGIIDSFAGYQEVLGKFLPPADRVTVRDFTGKGIKSANQIGSDLGLPHGTACAQIIYEMAPDVRLYLAQADTLQQFLDAMDWLSSQNVDVISLSISHPALPFDGKDPAAQKINDMRRKGIFISVAMANEAARNYVGTTTSVAGLFEFSEGQNLLPFGLPGKSDGMAIYFTWLDTRADFSIHLFDSTGKTEIGANARTNPKPTDLPLLYLPLPRTTGDRLLIAVNQRSGPSTTFRLQLGRGLTLSPAFRVASMSMHNTASASGAVGVAAAEVGTDRVPNYSSWGPTMDGRLKPDLSAPTHVSSYYYRGSETGFNGTSAATPHVAGAAALVKSRFPDFKADQIADFLLANVAEMRAPGGITGLFVAGVGRLALPDPSRLR